MTLSWLQRLSEEDVKAFSTFKEVYRRRDIDLDEDLLEVQRQLECGCLENRFASKPAESWSTARRHLGSNFDAIVQIGEKIDETLLEYQYQVASNEGMNSTGVPSMLVKKFGAKYPHYPSFIVAQEWRDWVNETIAQFHGLEAQKGLLEEIQKRLEWLESVELGLTDPGITDLHESYGWDTKHISLLQVLTQDVLPQLLEMRSAIDRSILEQSHAEVLKACFNLTKRLILDNMRFFECICHTETLRIQSYIADPDYALQESLFDFSVKYLCESLDEKSLLRHRVDGKAFNRFEKMNHLDRCLTVWYTYMRPQLIDQVTPEETSRGSWASLLKANEHFQNFFRPMKYGFNYDEYQRKGGRHESREPLRQHHYEGLKRCLSASALCLDPDQLDELLDVMSFFLARTLFAANQMANICLLQSSLSLLTGRLYINSLLSKNHILSTIEFMNSVADQMRNQVLKIKEILLSGWQRARRQSRSSHWANTRPLDNFRLAMQAKRSVDQILSDLEYILDELRNKVTSVTLKSDKDLKEEKDKHMLLYRLTWHNVSSWQQPSRLAPTVHPRIAPDWAREVPLHEMMHVEEWRNFEDSQVCAEQWSAFTSGAGGPLSLSGALAMQRAGAAGSGASPKIWASCCGVEP